MSETENSIWSATTLARDESAIRGAALSVRQRKLLALLNTPMSVDALATMSGIAHPEVEQNLQRFQKLGLAGTESDGLIAAAPSALRASTFNPATTAAAATSGSKLPFIVGGVTLTALAAAIWWFTRAEPAPAPSAPTASSSAPSRTAPAQSPTTATAPGDSATTNVFVSGAPAASDTAKQAAAKEVREALAKEAAKDAAKEASKAAKANAPATAAATQTAAAVAAPVVPAPVAAATLPTPTPAPTVAAPAPAPAQPPPAAAVVAAAPPPVAAPAARPAAATAREGALVSRVEPGFPRGAEVDRGTVRARLTVNATGAVTNVEILESNPPRVFDRNVRSALSQWRYEGTGEAQSKLVEVQFSR
jgi:TonB family protein